MPRKRAKNYRNLIAIFVTTLLVGTAVTGLSTPASAVETCDGRYEDYSTATIAWDDIYCEEGVIDDAEVLGSGNGDAYDDWGGVYAEDFDGDMRLVQGSAIDREFPEISFMESGFVAAGEIPVDILVTKSFFGNTATWDIQVFLEGTSTPHPIRLKMAVDSDEDLGADSNTRWTLSNGIWVSTESSGGENLRNDPAILFIIPTGATLEKEDGDDEVIVDLGTVSSAIVRHVLVGYEDCVTHSELMTHIDGLTSSLESTINSNLAIVQAVSDCTPRFTISNASAASFVIGEENSATFTFATSGDWNWSGGGRVATESFLPDDLIFEGLSEVITGTVPQLRISGLVAEDVEPGDYVIEIYLYDDYGNSAFGTLILNIQAKQKQLDEEVNSSKIPNIQQFELGYMVITPGTNAVITGARLDCTTRIWINDVATTFSRKVLPDGIYELSFAVPSSLSAGLHKVTMDSCDGIVVFENTLLVSKPRQVFTTTYASSPEIWTNLVAMRAFVNQHRNDFNSVECVAQTSSARESVRAQAVIQRYCADAFSRLGLQISSRQSVETGFSGPGTKITITLSNK